MIEVISEVLHPLEAEGAMFRSPELFIGVWVKSTISADPVCCVHIDFADEIGQATVSGNKALLARLDLTQIMTRIDFAEVHPTSASRLD